MVPRTGNEQVISRFKFGGAEAKAPHGGVALFDFSKFYTILVSEEDVSIILTNSEDLAIRAPIAIKTLGFSCKLIDVLSFGLPQSKVFVSCGCERLKNGVECESLDLGVVGVLK